MHSFNLRGYTFFVPQSEPRGTLAANARASIVFWSPIFSLFSSPATRSLRGVNRNSTTGTSFDTLCRCISGCSGLAMSHSSLGVAPLPEDDVAAKQLEDGSGSSASNHAFTVHEDRYDGVIVDPDSLPSEDGNFACQLGQSLQFWRNQGKKGVWLKLPIEKASCVPIAVEAGFKYHHAEPGYLMLTHWLADGPSTLPPNASHQVGIGAFVLNERNEVLAVQEKNGPLKGLGIWKMPTGLINQGEDIFQGAVREVKEETGVDTEFVELLGFRQGHHVAFEKSDLFFVCVLRPLSSEIMTQASEIEAAQWMPLEEYAEQEVFRSKTMLKQILDVCIANAKSGYRGFAAREMHSGYQQKGSYFYYNVHDFSQA